MSDSPKNQDSNEKLHSLDYSEDTDIHEIQEQIHGREKLEPSEGQEPIPAWYVIICFAVTAFCFSYFGMFSGGFSWTEYDERAGVANLFPGASKGGGAGDGAVAKVDKNSPEVMKEKGGKFYSRYCASCHGGTGAGSAGQYPTLIGSKWATGNGHSTVAVLLNGIKAGEGISGKKYSNVMAAWGPQLNDYQMAAVLTYVRTSWGNEASPIHPDFVKEQRAALEANRDPWTKAGIEAFNSAAAEYSADKYFAPAAEAPTAE